MSWEQGRAEVERLVAARKLETLPADARVTNALLDAAQRHVASARTIAGDDPVGAFQAAYDALRKAAAALLAAQGLRATSRGGHVAVQDAVRAQFGGPTGSRVFDGFVRMRRTRNSLEYPSGEGPDVDPTDVGWATGQADGAVRFALDLLSSDRLDPWG